MKGMGLRSGFMEVELAKLAPRGQRIVPIAIRKKLQLKEGDKVVFFADDNGIRIANASLLALEKA